jgi:hypothetical protein
MIKSLRASHAIPLIALAILSGCVQPVKTRALYTWGSFPSSQYETLLRTSSDPLRQIATLEQQAQQAQGKGEALPPGFRAHLGMLKLQIGNPSAAVELWKAEKEAFPESKPYMDRLLNNLNKKPEKLL